MGSERATIEELEMIHSPMQLNSPAHVAMDAGNLDDNDMDDSGDAGGDAGGGAGEPMSRDQRQQIQDLIRGRGPSLFNELEPVVDQAGADQENDSDDDSDGDSDDNGGRQSSAPLIQEEAQEPERLSSRSSGAPLIEEEEGDEVAAAEAPALDKSQLRPDVLGARDLAENAGATPGRNWVEAGEILQGDANSARRRGEGRYGAAALHGIADLAVSAGSGEAGGAAAGVVKGAMKPLAAPAMVGKLASDAVKYTVGGLVSAGGQAVQKIGDNKRDALDPEGLLEQQRLVDVANRNEYGIDMTSEKQGLTRREEVAARGVRMEQGDKAKKIWNGPKKRSWGRVTQNAIAAPFRGIGKAVKSLVTSPAAGLKSTVNFFSKYGRKAVNGISNIFNRKRRANNALERLRERSAANGEDRYPAAPANALKADSPLKQGTYNFRGGEASIRSHTRDVRKAQGFDNILGQKDYEKLSEADRREYKDKEKTLLTESPKYLGANDKVASDSNIIKGIAQKFADPDAQAQGDQQQAPANAPPGNAVAEASNDDFEMIPDNYASNFGKPELAKDSHPGMSIAEGIKKGVGVGEQLVETSKKLDAPVGIVTNFLGQQLPDMLEGQALEDYAPHAESAKAVGDTFKSINENAALYRAPLIGKGLNTGFDLYKTAKQSANRDKDANKTALNERQTLEDTREMSDRVRALLQEKKDAGASKESIARTSRLRNKMLMLRLVTANRKLAKAQEMNSITPLNEYSKKESDFIGTGDYTKDKEVGAKGVGELGKEAGKATVKTLKAVIGYGGANKADDSKEADRLYGPGGKFQGADAVADQNVIEEIEDEEKHASGELSAGGDSQLGAAGADQNVIKEEVNRGSDELNPIHHSDTNSYPQRQRPSQVDFNVSDDDDADVDAVAAGGGGAKIDQADDAGLDPDLLAQMNQFEGAENGMDGNPQGESVRMVSDFHDSVRSDGTTIERMGSVANDLQEQPMGGQGPQGPALGNGPMLNQLVDGQWQMMPEEEKGVAGEEEKSAQAPIALPNVNTGSGAVNVASEAFRDRLHAAKPKPKRVSPEYDVSESEAAEYQGLMAGEGMKDVSTRHEGLELPSARVHVPSEASDLPEWVSKFSGPSGELDFFDNDEEQFELGKDVIRNVDQYAPKMVKKSGPEETIKRVFEGYSSNDAERTRVRGKFLARERAREQDIDISSKKMLEGDAADPQQNRQSLQLPSKDAMEQSGPMTIGGHEVVPEMKNKYHDPDRPQGGWWRSKATGQKLGYAGLAGAEPVVSPGGWAVEPHGEFWQGNDVAYKKKREVRAKAKLDGIDSDALGEQLAEVSEQGRRQGYGGVADQGIVQAPAAGWGNIGKKPGIFAGKKAKEDYKQKTKAIDPDIDDAWGKMNGEAMPSFMKGVPYAEKKWREKERDQRALEEQEALRKKWGMGADQLRRL